MNSAVDAALFDAIIEPTLQAAKVPGAALAVVGREGILFARAYGWRDLDAHLPLTIDTVYPIASTSKAMNATLLGTLVEQGQLAWDAAVQDYLPAFRLHDCSSSSDVTVRDLLAMRTGLPRHDLVWIDSTMVRAELVEAISHLPLSAGLRERFQYSNLSSALAGHVAEVLTGQSWEQLVQQRIFEPLGMKHSGFVPPVTGEVTVSYHESKARKVVRYRRFHTGLIAPAGGSIHSTLRDMTRWVAFNLNGGGAERRQVLAPEILSEIHSPSVLMGSDPSAPSAQAAYGLGWAVDEYHGHRRLSHGGDLHDVNGCVTLFPDQGIGLVSFFNLSIPRLAKIVNQCVFERLAGLPCEQSVDAQLREYEKMIASTQQRSAAVKRVSGTMPSHALDAYVGMYVNAGYGRISIERDAQALVLHRNVLVLPLEHWHYDTWVIAHNDLFHICRQHPLDRATRIVFETDADGEIAALQMQPEPSVGPIRFQRHLS